MTSRRESEPCPNVPRVSIWYFTCLRRTGRLTATVKNGNTVKAILQKTIDTADGFSGTWYQQATLTDTVNSTPSPFHNNSFIEFISGRKVYLQSEHFIGATISHSESNLMISGWSNNNGVISFTPLHYGSNIGNMTLEGTDISGCKKFKLRLRTPLNPINPPIFLMNANGDTYEFSIRQDEESKNSGTNDSKRWHLSIMKIDTSYKVFDENVLTQTKAVNTSGWQKGIYLAVALIDNQYYAIKFSVGE